MKYRKFLLLVVLISFVPLIWFRPWDTLITSGDFWLPIGPQNFLKMISSSWLVNVSGGQVNRTAFEIMPWVGFWAFFKTLGLSLSDIEKVWFVALFFLGGFSMYLLTLEVFEEKRDSWKNFLPVVLYNFNVYTMMAGVVTTNLLVYMLSPMMLVFYIKGSKSTAVLKPAIRLALLSVFLTSTAGNPPIYTIPFLLAFSYLIFLLLSKRLTRSFLKFNLLCVFFYLLLNGWWLFFFIKNLTQQIGQIKEVADAAVVGPSSSLVDNIRLLGSWAFFADHLGTPYFPFASSYLNPPLMFLTFLVPALASAGIFFRSSRRLRLVEFFTFLALVGIFLSHGQGSDLLGQLYSFLKMSVPFFWIYREPFAKFTAITALSYAVLLGGFFAYLESRLRSRLLLNFLGLSATILILVAAWPMIRGDHYPEKRGVMASARKKIPQYWFEMAKWFEGRQHEGRVLILPDNPDWNRSGIPYAWGYDSADITPHLLSVPWIERNNGLYVEVLMENVSNVASFAYRTIHEDYRNPKLFLKTLSLLGVSRIMQRNDVDLERIGPLADNYSPERVRNILSEQEGIYLEKSFGALDIYRLEDAVVSEKFYVPKKSDCLSGDVQMLNYPLEFSDEIGQAALFSEFGDDSVAEQFNSERCSGHYIVPVEVLRRGTEFISLSYRSSFGGAEGTTTLPVDELLENEETRMGERLFIFRVLEDGVYDLYYEKFIGDEELSRSPTVTVSKLGEGASVVVPRATTTSSTPFLGSVGSFALSKGAYLVSFIDTSFNNFIDNFSFEDAPWQTTLSTDPIPLSRDAFLGQKSMSLSRGQTGVYYPFPKERLRPTTYEISFFYKVVVGLPPRFVTWENACSVNWPVWTRYDGPNDTACLSNFNVGKSLDAGSGWNEYRTDYIPSFKTRSAGLALVFLNEDLRVYPNTGETLIDYASFRPKIYGGLVLRMEKNSSQPDGPVLVVNKQSPTDYSVYVSKAQAPYYLVFSETFNDGWQTIIKDTNYSRVVSTDRHFIVNGYANSWYIDRLGDYEIEIRYVPERWFIILVIVSSLSVTSCLVYLIYPRVRVRFKMTGS